VIAKGADQLEVGPKDPNRFDRIVGSDLFEAGAVERLAPSGVTARLSEPDAAGALAFHDARVIEPATVLEAWLEGVDLAFASVAAIEPAGGGWRLIDAEGSEIARADLVCLACGLGAARLAPDLPLTPLRGQVSLADVAPPGSVIGGGYAIPTREGVLFGATHDRGDADDAVRTEDHQRNLGLLAAVLPGLAARLDVAELTGRAGVRAVTPDFLPLAGPLEAPGLYILSGLGSRGFCAAPLLAEHVAALALGAPSPLPAALAEIVHPGRFAVRRKRRLGRSAKVQVLDPT
jgi:tRNA 5-methylaminomethyl-2-thiouridine biosynthesis bifunctional protein